MNARHFLTEPAKSLLRNCDGQHVNLVFAVLSQHGPDIPKKLISRAVRVIEKDEHRVFKFLLRQVADGNDLITSDSPMFNQVINVTLGTIAAFSGVSNTMSETSLFESARWRSIARYSCLRRVVNASGV